MILVGFSPPERLGALARYLGWPGLVLADQDRRLYRRLGIGRARWWRIYNPGTVRIYGAALARGGRLNRPVEDTRQLGADAIMVDGVVRTLWRPRSPDGRPHGRDVVAAAHRWLEADRGERSS